MLKNNVQVIKKRGLYYISDDKNNVSRFKPWLGDSFSFLYDYIMKNSIFPKKFGSDINLHYQILRQVLKDISGKRVLELATGTGSVTKFLANNNHYTGTDISPGLLRKAMNNFRDADFQDTAFYVVSADDLPFTDDYFEIVLCILSLNFFIDIKKVFQEVKRVLIPGSEFICCVPVPERNKRKSTIRGMLYSEKELEKICKDSGFNYMTIPFNNGALLYFKAILRLS